MAEAAANGKTSFNLLMVSTMVRLFKDGTVVADHRAFELLHWNTK
jgi:hypothetical protein